MRQFLLVASVTIVGFAAGGAAGIYYERNVPLPVAPGQLGSELGGHRPPPWGPNGKPINRARLIEQLAQLRPQIESYKAKVDGIDAEFERGLAAILTPDQLAIHAGRLKRRNERERPGGSLPLTDDQIARTMQWSGYQVLRTVVIDLRLQDLVKELKLDAGQQDKVRALLHVRRAQMIALVDSVPPPSITLVNLAPMIQRLAPAKAGTASLK
jgi:hypothetical protein